jgi:hypothetical protein
MPSHQRIARLALILAALCLAGIGTILVAQNPGLAPHVTDKALLTDDEVKRLLLLMDADQNGKISKQEFMNFMEKEFDRLDKDKSGELDINELRRSQFRPGQPFAHAGK